MAKKKEEKDINGVVGTRACKCGGTVYIKEKANNRKGELKYTGQCGRCKKWFDTGSIL